MVNIIKFPHIQIAQRSNRNYNNDNINEQCSI